MSVAEVAIRVGQLEEEEDIFWMGTHSYTPCPHAGLVTGHQSHPAPPFKQSRKVELVSPPAAAAGRGGESLGATFLPTLAWSWVYHVPVTGQCSVGHIIT